MRTFIAIVPPDEVLASLSYETDALDAELSGKLDIRVTPRDKLHFTIIFLDSQEEGDIPAIKEAVEKTVGDAVPFEMEVTRLDYGPEDGAKRMVWAYGESEELSKLEMAIRHELTEDGIAFPRVKGKFVPHMTLARFDPQDRGVSSLPVIGMDIGRKFTVSKIDILASEWPEGDEYHVLASVDLSSAKG